MVHSEYGNDNEISDDSYEVVLFLEKMEKFKPKFIAFTSKKAASFALGYWGNTKMVNYGFQSKMIGYSEVFILPSPSGNARRYWNVDHWLDLYKEIN